MDIFSAENSTTSSPRISFSHNLDNSLIDTYPYRSDSSSDFDFCITTNPIENQPSSADELFRDGLIRYEKVSFMTTSSSPSTDQSSNHERSKEIVSIKGREPNQSKSFWRIKRSSSLHCESTKQKSSFWSSLPLLSRSNSTGCVVKEGQNKRNQLQKQSKSSSSSSMAVYSSQKPPLKRNYGGAHDYGVGISPVLNVPPPFVSKTAADLLGLGSFFRHGNDQKSNKY